MIGRSFVLALFISMLIVDAAFPRMRPTKKAMRNSLVRFGKRNDMPDMVIQGEPYGIDGSNVFYRRVAQLENQLHNLYE